MKKFLITSLLPLLFTLQACAVEQWQEGEHYIDLDTPVTAKPEVVEYFSFWCGHCYHFEPLVAELKQRLDKSTRFEKVQVNFMGFTSKSIQDDATRAMIIARELGKEDALNEAIFKFIHQQQQQINGLKDIRSLYIVNDVEPHDFDRLAKTAAVQKALDANNQQLAAYRKHLSGVPTFIVNGKYKARFADGMSPDDFIALIIWLTQQK